ncbi:MAG TPA: hypothetical protein VF493_01970, partial [Terriglobales bacterium]
MIIFLPRERVTIFEQSADHQAIVCANAETQAPSRSLPLSSQTPESCSVQAEICHATDIKEHAVVHICKPEQNMLANAAARYYTRTLHVQMCFCEALFR